MRTMTWLVAAASAVLSSSIGLAQNTWLISNDPLEQPDFPSIGSAVASPLAGR